MSVPLDYLNPGETIVQLHPARRFEIQRDFLVPDAQARINILEQELASKIAIFDASLAVFKVAVIDLQNVVVNLPPDNGDRPEPPPPPSQPMPPSYAQNPAYVAAVEKVNEAEKARQKAADEVTLARDKLTEAEAGLETIENAMRQYQEDTC